MQEEKMEQEQTVEEDKGLDMEDDFDGKLENIDKDSDDSSSEKGEELFSFLLIDNHKRCSQCICMYLFCKYD